MKSVLFIIHNNRADGVRRSLMLADALADMDINSFFLSPTNNFQEFVQKQAQQLSVRHVPQCIPLEFFTSFNPKQKINLHLKKRTMDDVFCNPSYPHKYPTGNKLGRQLKTLGVNNKALIEFHVERELSGFINNLKAAERILDEIKPSCIIHDIEITQKNRAVFYAAKQSNINVISMEHGEGRAEQYKEMPAFSDYYIAYSFYNHEILRGMGVEEEKILITGLPDTDLIYNYNKEAIKEDLKSKYHVDFNKKVLLFVLRPSKYKFYFNMNIELLNILRDHFADNSDFEIVVKQHPVDLSDHVKTDYYKLYTSEYPKMKVIEGDFTISKLYAVSDYCLTHKSSAIVEAILQDVSTIVIENDDAKWPDWNKFDVYTSIKIEDIAGSLQEIRSGVFDEKAKHLKGGRQEFIRYFRYKFDNQATMRIANAINGICRNAHVCIADTERYRQSDKELFRQGFQYLQTGDMSEALRCFDEAARSNTTLPGLHFARAIALAQIGKLFLSREACQEELRSQPDHDEAKKFLERIEQAILERGQAVMNR